MTGALAQKTNPELLPGGATSLTEGHGDWTVACRLTQRDKKTVRHCSLSQQQTNKQRRRTIAVELQPKDDGVGGAIVLPFGLAVTQKVRLTIDEAKKALELSFSTCLPAGCIVPVTFDTTTTKALRQGTSLTIVAPAADGEEVKLSIPLKGFASALDRIRALLK